MLIVYFVLVIVAMLYLTVTASLEKNLLQAIADLRGDLWFQATLADAYFAFFCVWLWIASRERSNVNSALWFLLIIALGNFAIAMYFLLQLKMLKPGDGLRKLFADKSISPEMSPS